MATPAHHGHPGPCRGFCFACLGKNSLVYPLYFAIRIRYIKRVNKFEGFTHDRYTRFFDRRQLQG